MQTEKTENHSSEKTKALLMNCLLCILKDKPVSAVKVSDLCRMADISRGAFYFHYKDIYDMLDKEENVIHRQFSDVVNCYTGKDLVTSSPDLFTTYFQLIQSYESFCAVLFGPNGDRQFLEKCKQTVGDVVILMLRDLDLGNDEEKNKYIKSYVVNGFVGITESWLASGCKETPAEMSELAMSLLSPLGEKKRQKSNK